MYAQTCRATTCPEGEDERGRSASSDESACDIVS